MPTAMHLFELFFAVLSMTLMLHTYYALALRMVVMPFWLFQVITWESPSRSVNILTCAEISMDTIFCTGEKYRFNENPP
jgi:hypothetical protein